jgi:hypothetical protein
LPGTGQPIIGFFDGVGQNISIYVLSAYASTSPRRSNTAGYQHTWRSDMYKQILTATLFFALTPSAIAATERPTMAGVVEPNDPRAKEAYTYQCKEWAAQSPFENEQAREAYIENCVSDMAKVWPLGMDESE